MNRVALLNALHEARVEAIQITEQELRREMEPLFRILLESLAQCPAGQEPKLIGQDVLPLRP